MPDANLGADADSAMMQINGGACGAALQLANRAVIHFAALSQPASKGLSIATIPFLARPVDAFVAEPVCESPPLATEYFPVSKVGS